MQFRPLAALAVLATAAACGSLTEPTRPADAPSTALNISDPPPPPLDTQAVAFQGEFQGTSFTATGRYFANRTGTSVWLAFVGNGAVGATPNARLQYNPKSGRTSGQGSLLLGDGSVVPLPDLRLVESTLGRCAVDGRIRSCGSASLYLGERKVGGIAVVLRDQGPIVVD